jgi:inhibitor of cysteine peptidase
VSVVHLGPDDRGREVTVAAGDRLVLRLPENPTTGFRWTWEAPNTIQVTRDENEPGSAPGAAGVRVLELIAVEPGRAALELSCRRAWDPNVPPTDRFELTVEVRPANTGPLSGGSGHS